MCEKLGFAVSRSLRLECLIILAVGLHSPVNGALCIALGGIGTLVVQLFAFAQAHFHFYAAMLEIKRERHQRIALQFALLVQTPDLTFVRQKPPDTHRTVSYTHLVRKDENSAYKVGWIALIGLLPLLGGALYLAFGNKRPSRRLRSKIYLDCCFDALRQEQALWSDILPDLA